MPERKTFVLDTNVLIHNPESIFVFEEHDIVIPAVVLEELNKFKWQKDEVGWSAREAGRILDGLSDLGDLTRGINLKHGGTLRVELNHKNVEIPASWELKSGDNRILQVCTGLKGKNRRKKVILVSKDVLLRIKARALGLEAEDFNNDKTEQNRYTGRAEVMASPGDINSFFSGERSIPGDRLFTFTEEGREKASLLINQFLLISSSENPRQTALGRFDGEKAVPLRFFSENQGIMGLHPKSIGQKFMLEALLAPPSVCPLALIMGQAGTGKTLLALAAGLSKVMERESRKYRRVLFLRPNSTMEDIGFLPGTEQNKIDPLLRPVYDNLEIILDNDSEKRYDDERILRDKIDEIFDRKFITAEALAFLRGRSLAHQYVIIDEAQNLTPNHAKAIITRAGEGTKVILLGDPGQIDRPFLDSCSNGLAYSSERMKNSPLCYQLMLQDNETERSPLSAEAASLL